MKNNGCPCKNCLCLPVCKHKNYETLIDCYTVFKFLYTKDDHNSIGYQKKILKVIKLFKLQPIFVFHSIISQKQTFGNH